MEQIVTEIKKTDLNSKKKVITILCLILKVTKTNADKKNWLKFNEGFITTIILILKLTKSNTDEKTGLF